MLLKRLFWTAGFVLMAPLGLALYLRLTTGHELAGYGSVVPWGLWVAQYLYFAGLSAGAFLISSLVYVFGVQRLQPIGRLAVFTSLVTLGLALFTLWMDLGRLERFWHVFLYPNFRSPMTWMTFLYSAFFALLVVEFWFLMRADLVIAKGLPGWRRWPALLGSLGSTDLSERSLRRDARIVRVLAAVGVPLAIMFSGGVGALFGVLVARPFWHSGLYPVIFLVSALASGAALLALASAIFQEGWRAHREMIVALGRLVLGLLLLDALILFSEFLIGAYGGRPDWIASLSVAIGGPYWWVFWVAQIGFGLVIPVAILASPLRLDPRAVAVACGLVLLGFIGVRLNVVLPGLSPEEIAGLVAAVGDPRVQSEYFPSPLEWMMSIGIGGLGLILFGIGEIFLPLSHHLRPLPGGEEAGLAEQATPAGAEA